MMLCLKGDFKTKNLVSVFFLSLKIDSAFILFIVAKSNIYIRGSNGGGF